MTVKDLKEWFVDNGVPEGTDILLAPAGEPYIYLEEDLLSYDDDSSTGEAVVITI